MKNYRDPSICTLAELKNLLSESSVEAGITARNPIAYVLKGVETFDSSDSSVPESYLNLAITSLDRKPDKYESMEAYKSSNEYKSTKVWAYLVSVALKCRKSDLNVDPMIKEAVGKGETVSEGAEKALCAFMAIIAEEALTKKNPVKEKILLCALKKSSELPEGELKNRWHGYIHYLFEKHVDQSKNKDEVREKFNKNYKKYHDTTSLFGYMKSFDVNHSSEMDLDLFIQLIKILQAKDEDIDLAPDVLSELKDSLNQFPFKNAALIAQGLGSESLMIKNQKFLKFDLQNLGELRLYIKTLMTLKNDPGQVQDKINQLAQDFIVEVSNYKNDEKIKATPEHYFDYAKELSDSVINLLKEQSISKETAINSINNQFLNAEFKGRDIDVFLKIIVSLVESQLFLFDDLVGFFKKIASNATLNEDSRYKIYCQWAGYLKYQGKIDDASQVLLQIPIDHIRSEYQKTLELSVNDEVLKESINYLVQPMSSSLAIENNKEADIETLKKLSEKGIPDATFALSFRFATDSENYIKFLNQALTQIKAVPNKAKPLYALLEAGIKIKLAYVYFRGFQNKLNNGTKVYDQDVKDLFMHCCESFGRTKVLPSSDADNFYSLIEKFHSGIKDTHYWTLMLLLYAVNPKLMKEMLLQKPNVISSLKGAKDKYNTDTKPSEFNGIIGDLYMRNSKGEISEKFQAYFFLPEGDQQMSYDTALRHYYDTRFKDIRQDARIKYVILNTVNQKMVSKFSPDYYEYGFWEDYNRGDGHRTTVEMSDYFNQFLRDNNLRGRLLIDSNGKCMATGYSWDSETEYGRRKHCSAKEIDFYDPFRDDYVKNVYGEMENRSFLDVPGQISKLMDANLLSNEMLLLVCQSWLNAIANRKFDIKDQAQLWENKLYIANIFCKNKQQDSITEEIFKEAISIDRREKNTNQITRAIKIGVLTEVLAEKLFMSHYIHSNISGSAKFELLSLLDEKFRESKSEDAVRKNLDRVFIIDQHEKNTSSIIRSIDNTLFKEPDDLTFVTSVKELLPQYVASKAFSQEQVDYLYFYYLNAFKNIYSQQSSDLNTVLSQIPDRVRRLAIMIQLGYATDQDKRDYYTLRKEDLILEGVAAKGKIVDRDSFMKAFEIFNNIFKMDSALRQLTKVEKIEKIEDATPAKPPLPFTLPTDVSLGQFFSLINVDLEKFKKTNSIKSLIEKKLYYNDNRIIGNLIAASKKQKLLIEDPKEQLDLTGFRTALTTAMQDKDISPDLKRLLQEIHQQFTEIGGCYEVNLPSPAYSIQGHQSSPSA